MNSLHDLGLFSVVLTLPDFPTDTTINTVYSWENKRRTTEPKINYR